MWRHNPDSTSFFSSTQCLRLFRSRPRESPKGPSIRINTECKAMSSASNIYSADPALPVLADGLLRQPKPTETDTTSHNPKPRYNWDLKDDWLRGVRSSKQAVFRSGVVLGFSRLQGRSNESNEYIAQVSLTPPPKVPSS